ncbi:TIR domain-containing protein [Streptomyces himastatinicus]|nr:nucleotide-binding protein [Streptomyces himastatinicus]
MAKEEMKARMALEGAASAKERKTSWLEKFTPLRREQEDPRERADYEYQRGLEHLHQERVKVANLYSALKRIELARWEEWTESQQAIEIRKALYAQFNSSVAEAINHHAMAWVNHALSSEERKTSQKDSEMSEAGDNPRTIRGSRKKVFLIHGRHEKIASDIRTFLRALSLEPVEWSQAKSSLKQGAPYIGDIVMAGMRLSDAVVVLLTPDELVELRPELAKEVIPATAVDHQARPNVYYEAGIADALDRDHTIIVEIGTVRPFSDVSGRHVVRFNGSQQARLDLRDALRSADLLVDDSGRDWISVGSFDERVAT